MNAYQLFEAAIENANQNDIEINAQYFIDYAENAYNEMYFINNDLANKMLELSKNDYANRQSDKYFEVEQVLGNIKVERLIKKL